jgi:hypothetical protein
MNRKPKTLSHFVVALNENPALLFFSISFIDVYFLSYYLPTISPLPLSYINKLVLFALVLYIINYYN